MGRRGPISQCTIPSVLPRPAPGRLYVVATPIGNLEDITVRALRVLREARVIAAEDTRRTAKLLAHAGIETPMVSLHAHNEAARLPAMLERLRAGEAVALVTDAGTPLLSDPGDQLIRAALDEGIVVEPIPGASAVLAALTMSGVPSSQFTFLGFPPVKQGPRRRWCEEAASYQHPVVFFEAPAPHPPDPGDAQGRGRGQPEGRRLPRDHQASRRTHPGTARRYRHPTRRSPIPWANSRASWRSREAKNGADSRGRS